MVTSDGQTEEVQRIQIVGEVEEADLAENGQYILLNEENEKIIMHIDGVNNSLPVSFEGATAVSTEEMVSISIFSDKPLTLNVIWQTFIYIMNLVKIAFYLPVVSFALSRNMIDIAIFNQLTDFGDARNVTSRVISWLPCNCRMPSRLQQCCQVTQNRHQWSTNEPIETVAMIHTESEPAEAMAVDAHIVETVEVQ